MGSNFKDIIEESLNEEVVSGIKDSGGTHYLLKNPSLKELKEIALDEGDDSFRLVISEEGNFYFATASNWIHAQIADNIEANTEDLIKNNYYYCYDLSNNTFYFNMTTEDDEEAEEYFYDFYCDFKNNSYVTSTFGDFKLVMFDKSITGDTPFDYDGTDGLFTMTAEEIKEYESRLDECCSATCAGDIAATVLPFGGIGSRYKAKKGDWKKSAEQINKEIVDNMV